MDWLSFAKLIKQKSLVGGRAPDQKTLATLADGWIGPMTASWTDNGVESSEYWFGFVEKEKLIKKAVVRFDRDHLVSVRYFEETGWSDLTPQERRETRVENLDAFLYTPGAYAKAEARAPKLKEGIDRHEFEEIMEVSYFYIGNGFFWSAAPGMLNELYKPPTEDTNNMPGTFYFGYRQGKTPVPKFSVEFRQNRIAKIEWLQDGSHSNRAVQPGKTD